MSRAWGCGHCSSPAAASATSVLWFPTNTVVCGSMQLAKRVQVRVDLALVPPRQVGHVGDQGHIGVVGRDLCNGADIASGLPTKPTLNTCTGTSSRMVRACSATAFFVEGEMVDDLGGVAHIGAGHNWAACAPTEAMAVTSAGQAARAAGVAGIETSNAGRRDSVSSSSSSEAGLWGMLGFVIG
jgi:hypothetical protein